MKALRIAAQFALYIPLMAILAYFSTEPRFSMVAPDEALVRVSFIHATQRKEACRERSAEELAKLAPNMRAAQDCPRERSPLLVELELDGKLVLRREVQPSGLRRDGNVAVYERLSVPAGRHRIVARLRDRAEGDHENADGRRRDDRRGDRDQREDRERKGMERFDHVADRTLDLPAGGVLVIDFNAARGGFEFLI